MVFPSIPAYNLDPTNWHQQTESFLPSSTTTTPHLLPSPPLPPNGHPHGPASGSGSSIRPGSMAERARMANIPMPEAAMKCPRCESTNTKFCYFNNYSLTQPRHFCKTCKRYWTKGGALRNVPVGGGCRRSNKRSSKGSSSKSPVSTGTSSGASLNYSSAAMDHIMGLSSQISAMRFMANPLNRVTEFGSSAGSVGLNYGFNNYSGFSGDPMNFQAGMSSTGLGLDDHDHHQQWPLEKMSQLPFLSGLECPSIQGTLLGSSLESGFGYNVGLTRPKSFISGFGAQVGSISANYSANWSDPSGFSSSSTTSNAL